MANIKKKKTNNTTKQQISKFMYYLQPPAQLNQMYLWDKSYHTIRRIVFLKMLQDGVYHLGNYQNRLMT